jgi:hypothetical protein
LNKRISTKYLVSIALLILSTTSVVALNVQSASALEDHEITTVMILPATGGTTNLDPGNYSYGNGTMLTMTANPSAGYKFLYWNVTGIMNTQGDHDSMATDTSDMEHGGPFGELSDLDSLILTDSEVTIKIDCAYTYQYQPVFAPTQNSSPTPTNSNTNQQQTNDADNSLIYIAVGIVGAVAALGAGAGFFLKNKKSSPVAS